MVARFPARERIRTKEGPMPALNRHPDELLLAALEASEATEYAAGEPQPLTTGNKIVTFKQGAAEAALAEFGGSRAARASDFAESAVQTDGLGGADLVMFEELGVAVIDGQSDAAASMMAATESAAGDSAILAIEDEGFAFATNRDLERYLAGFSAAAQRIHADLVGAPGPTPAPDDLGPLPGDLADPEADAQVAGVTWGLVATRAHTSRFSGRGIRVAVLDTGFDFGHPNFIGRPIVSQSFIPGESAQDLHGHGTHCTGTACGPRAPAGAVPRYGVAFEALIHIGKVLANSGNGTQLGILNGMNWAIARRCEVISMSLRGLGAPVVAYTAAGAAALATGCLIVAATGNDSARPGLIRPTGTPANSPSVMAVGGVDSAMRMYTASNGGKVEIAGPAVGVFSSLPRPRLHGTFTGTSMATPHVAGCAALWAQTNSGLRGRNLWAALQRTVRGLPHPARDVGAGLVQAPQ
jgi:subtilisin